MVHSSTQGARATQASPPLVHVHPRSYSSCKRGDPVGSLPLSNLPPSPRVLTTAARTNSAGTRRSDYRIAGRMQVCCPVGLRASQCYPARRDVTGGPRHCRSYFRLLFRERDVSILPVPGKDSIRTFQFFQVSVLYLTKVLNGFLEKPIVPVILSAAKNLTSATRGFSLRSE